MQIKSVQIKNFRSIDTLDVDFGDVTVFVGPNGAGKSTILRALDWFFNGDASWLSDEDKHHSKDDLPIRVRVTFNNLSSKDREALGPKYGEESLESFTVWHTWQDGMDKITARAKAFRSFEAIRSLQGAKAQKDAYKSLRQERPDLGLPVANTQAAIVSALDAWERSHPDQLDEAEVSDTHFFGFNGRGKLSSLFDFVFVSADLRATEETADARGTVLGRILERTLDRKAIETESASLISAFEDQYADLAKTHLSPQLEKVGKTLTASLARFTASRTVGLSAAPPAVKVPPARVDVRIGDGQIQTGVGAQGHGMQRALLVSALTVLSDASRVAESEASMFLAIEEPELFQHPTQAKAFASVLSGLGYNEQSNTQVAYATHSPHFVDPRYFDEVRRVTLARGPETVPHTQVTSAKMDEVIQDLAGFVAPDPIRRRWSQTCINYLAEAIFADAVILVEGDEDAAILQGSTGSPNELAIQGIAVAPTSGKGNVFIPYAILKRLGVPTLIVVDNDSGCAERMKAKGKSEEDIEEAVQKHKKDNRRLCDFVGAQAQDYPVGAVSGTLAFIPDTLETLLASDMPNFALKQASLVAEGRGVPGKHAATYELAVRECADSPSKHLTDTIDMARRMRAL